MRKKFNTCISNLDFDDNNVDMGNVMTDEPDHTYSRLIQKAYSNEVRQIHKFFQQHVDL